MQIRTFIGVVISMLLVVFIAGIGYQNSGLLDQTFQLTPTRTVPLWTAMVGAFIAGVLTFLVAFLLRGSAGLIERLRMLQGRRAGRAVADLYERGIEAALEGHEERALEHFRAILSRNPDHFQALLKAGSVHRSLGRVQEAVEMHKRAHRLQDTSLEPLYELVKDYEALDQVAKAKVVLDRIIEMRPRRALSAFRSLRRYAIKEGDWDRAWNLQRRIESQVERDPAKLSAERRFGIGIRYEMAGEASREGREREALNSLRKLARAAPDFVPAQFRLGEILAERGLDDDAVQVWFQGFRQTGAPAFLSRLEEHYLDSEDPEGAIRVLQNAVAESGHDFLPRFFLAKLYLRLEMIDEAWRELQLLSDRATGSPVLHAHLGYVHERRREFQAASEAYRRVIQDQDYLQLQYRCQSCQHATPKWHDRCERCDAWNTIVLDFGEDPGLEALDLTAGPVYSHSA